MAETVASLSGQMSRIAFEALKRWTGATPQERERRHAALRELPLLIRRHGLRRTLLHWLAEGEGNQAKDEMQHAAVARAFALAMQTLAPGQPHLAGPCSNSAHMLQTRLALALADESWR